MTLANQDYSTMNTGNYSHSAITQNHTRTHQYTVTAAGALLSNFSEKVLYKYSITIYNFLEDNHLQELYVFYYVLYSYLVTYTHSGSQPNVDSVLCLGLLVHNVDIGWTLPCAHNLPTGARSAPIFLPPVEKKTQELQLRGRVVTKWI